MKIYIEIKEVLSRVVTVDAESKNDAITKVENMYFNEEIVLDYEDFEGETSIKTINIEAQTSFK